MTEILGADGKPMTYAIDPILVERLRDRAPRLTDPVHYSDGEHCSAAWVVHVNVNTGGAELLLAHGPGDLRATPPTDRLDVPQMSAGARPPHFSWHYPDLCPWRR